MRSLNLLFVALCLYGFSATASEIKVKAEQEESKKASATEAIERAHLEAVWKIFFKNTHINEYGNQEGPGLPDELADKVCTFVDEWNPSTMPMARHSSVYDLKLAPDKSFLVQNSFDGFQPHIILYDLVRQEQIRSLADNRSGKVTISPTSTHIATCSDAGSSDKSIHLWDKNSGAKVQTFAGHTRYGKNCRFPADGTRLVSIGGLSDGAVKLWDVQTGQCIQTQHHSDHHWMDAVDISDDGNLLVSGGGSIIKVWDVRSGHCEKIFYTEEPINEFRFIPGDTSFVSAESYQGIIKKWVTTCDEPVCIFDHKMAMSLALSREGAYLVSGGAIGQNPSNYVRVWNVNTGKCLHEFAVGNKLSIDAVDISADGSMITAVGGYDDCIKVWTKQDMYKIITAAQHDAEQRKKKKEAEKKE